MQLLCKNSLFSTQKSFFAFFNPQFKLYFVHSQSLIPQFFRFWRSNSQSLIPQSFLPSLFSSLKVSHGNLWKKKMIREMLHLCNCFLSPFCINLLNFIIYLCIVFLVFFPPYFANSFFFPSHFIGFLLSSTLLSSSCFIDGVISCWGNWPVPLEPFVILWNIMSRLNLLIVKFLIKFIEIIHVNFFPLLNALFQVFSFM